jgi:hypothetical protein
MLERSNVEDTHLVKEEKDMRLWKSLVLAGLSTLVFSGIAPAYFDDYDDSESHPLRIVSYAIHPIGYTVDQLLMRPLHALVSQPELAPIFGHTPHEWAIDENMPRVTETPTVAPPPIAAGPAVNPADIDAARRSADEARAAADEAKRAAEEAARAAEKATRAFDKSLRK